MKFEFINENEDFIILMDANEIIIPIIISISLLEKVTFTGSRSYCGTGPFFLIFLF